MIVLSWNRSPPTKIFCTPELTYTAAKAAQVQDKSREQKAEWKDSSIMVNGTNHSLQATKVYPLKEYVDIFQAIGNLNRKPMPHQTEAVLWASTASTVFATSWCAKYLQSRAAQAANRRHHSWCTQALRVSKLYSTSTQTRWLYKVMPRSKIPEQGHQKEPMV